MNKLILIPKEFANSFIKDLNDSVPSKEFMESCEKAGRLFKQSSDNKEGNNDRKK